MKKNVLRILLKNREIGKQAEEILANKTIELVEPKPKRTRKPKGEK